MIYEKIWIREITEFKITWIAEKKAPIRLFPDAWLMAYRAIKTNPQNNKRPIDSA